MWPVATQADQTVISAITASGLSRVDEAAHLAVPEAGVVAAFGEELAMRAVFEDAALIEIDHPVHAGDGRETVRNRDHGAALHQRPEARLDQMLALAVER